MPEQPASAILAAAAREVLETMFFAELRGRAPYPETPDQPQLCACVRFRGRPSGAFCLRLSGPAARTMAANFLGAQKEEDLSAAQVGEVVCELANMICGSVLSRLENQAGFDIFYPELLSGPACPEVDERAVSRVFGLENGRLEVFLRLDQN